MDTDGTPYAKSELVTNETAAYQHEFERLQQVRTRRDAELALAAQATGVERARHLDAVLTTVGSLADSEYAELERQVTELDPQNVAGLRAKYEPVVTHRNIDRAIQEEVYPLADRGQYRAAIDRLDRLVVEARPSRSQLQLLLAFKGQLYFSLKDKRAAAKLLDEAIALDPNSESGRRARDAKQQFAALP